MKKFEDYTKQELVEIYKEKKLEAVRLMEFEVAALWRQKEQKLQNLLEKEEK